MKKELRLPDGTTTVSLIKYIRAYRKLARPICKLFKEESKYGYSCDPGLSLGRLSLTDSQAIKIYELITKKRYHV